MSNHAERYCCAVSVAEHPLRWSLADGSAPLVRNPQPLIHRDTGKNRLRRRNGLKGRSALEPFIGLQWAFWKGPRRRKRLPDMQRCECDPESAVSGALATMSRGLDGSDRPQCQASRQNSRILILHQCSSNLRGVKWRFWVPLMQPFMTADDYELAE